MTQGKAGSRTRRPLRVCSIFGTRPEAIKLLPVLRALATDRRFHPSTVVTAQHTELLDPLLARFGIAADVRLDVQRAGQPLDDLMGRLMPGVSEALRRLAPDVVLVQGDTTSALAGALAAHHARLPLAHIEAGLRSGDRYSPFPEEMNRRLISRLAALHFAATPLNRDTLIAEGVAPAAVTLTGNPVVDALRMVRTAEPPSADVLGLLDWARGRRLIVVTTHRRENFDGPMRQHLATLAEFVGRRPDMALAFIVHPNPAVRREAEAALPETARVRHVAPLVYPDFLHLLAGCWLIASDSGGVQEEAPSLGKPLLILRANTERPEVVRAGCARLVGADPARLAELLAGAARAGSWAMRHRPVANPFGDGNAATRIVAALVKAFHVAAPAEAPA